jgi:hypothetical protein
VSATPDDVSPPGIEGGLALPSSSGGSFPVATGVAIVAASEVVLAAALGLGPSALGIAVRYVVLAALAFLGLGALFPDWARPVASSYLRPWLVFAGVSAALLVLAVVSAGLVLTIKAR